MGKQWYYVVDGERRGPLDHEAIMTLFVTGLLPADTPVWCEGLGNWRPASEVLGVSASPSPPPVPAVQGVEPVQPAVAATPEREVHSTSDVEPAFFNVGAGRFLVFDVISMGMFETYWSYRNWKYIRDHEGRSLSPFWRAGFGLFWMHDLMRSITQSTTLRAAAVPTHSPGALATGWVIGTIFCRIGNRFESVAFLVIIGWIISIACMMPIRGYINQANASMSPRRGDSSTGVGLVLMLLVGVVIWVAAFALPDANE